MSITQDFNTSLKAVFGQIFGDDVTSPKIRRLSGGASQETWHVSRGDKRVILRRAPNGVSRARSSAAIGLAKEAQLIEAAREAGIPVPEVLHVLTPPDGLGDGFLMSHISGETIARPILRDEQFASAREALAQQCGHALAGIHCIPTTTLPDLPESGGLQQLSQYEAIYRGFGVSRPVFELAIAFLQDTAPTAAPLVLVHGDFRLGNLMVNESGLAAILDWELAHLGDPREDLAWICVNSWRFGQSQNRVGGFGQIEDFLAAYHEAGGAAFTPKDIDWWEMLGSLKWGIMCMIMYEAFRSGADPSVERAAIGRRVSETEMDLLNLLEAHNA